MSLIPRQLDDADNPRLTYKTTLENLVRSLANERCLIFLGAGTGVDTSQPSLPTGTHLAQDLAAKCGLTWHESVPLSTVAYYYEFYFDRENLNEVLVERIGNPAIRPSSANRLVAELMALLEKRGRSTFTITTNYDQQLETAYREITGRSCGVITYKGGWDAHDREKRLHDGLGERPPKFWLPRRHSYIYKMHGCISQPSGRGLVVTEEDYINFLDADHRPVVLHGHLIQKKRTRRDLDILHRSPRSNAYAKSSASEDEGEQTMYCSKCGSVLNSVDWFCSKCGLSTGIRYSATSSHSNAGARSSASGEARSSGPSSPGYSSRSDSNEQREEPRENGNQSYRPRPSGYSSRHSPDNSLDSRVTFRVMEWIISEYKNKTGIDASTDETGLAYIEEVAKQAKIVLSFRSETEITLPLPSSGAPGPAHFAITLTRARYYQMVTGKTPDESAGNSSRSSENRKQSKSNGDESPGTKPMNEPIALALADPSLDFRVPDDDKLPGLLIRSAGRKRRATNGVLDQLERDGLRGEDANCAPRGHPVQKLARVPQLFFRRHASEIQGNVLIGFHRNSIG